MLIGLDASRDARLITALQRTVSALLISRSVLQRPELPPGVDGMATVVIMMIFINKLTLTC